MNLDKALLIDGWMSYYELEFLAKTAATSKCIVEFGSYKGRSTRALADNTSGIVYAVDPWKKEYYQDDGSLSGINPDVYKEFFHNLEDHIRSGKVIPVPFYSHEFTLDIKPDFVFIDGDHREESVRRDIKIALSYLGGSGIIAGHDYGHDDWPSVKRVVDEYFGINNFQLIDSIWAVNLKEKNMDSNVKVLIGVPTKEETRNAIFYDYFNLIDKPMGTMVMFSRGQSPARNRNIIIREALKHNCTHILFIDDDTAPPPNILTKLLSHDKDIVTGLYLMRNYPHLPIIFDIANSDGSCGHHFLTSDEKGLIEIVNCGLGAVLIKTEVFKNMSEPWITLGECEKDHWCDDISFFNRARKMGYKLYCDLDIRVGHFCTTMITPVYRDNQWMTQYDTPSGNMALMVPQVILLEKEKVNA